MGSQANPRGEKTQGRGPAYLQAFDHFVVGDLIRDLLHSGRVEDDLAVGGRLGWGGREVHPGAAAAAAAAAEKVSFSAGFYRPLPVAKQKFRLFPSRFSSSPHFEASSGNKAPHRSPTATLSRARRPRSPSPRPARAPRPTGQRLPSLPHPRAEPLRASLPPGKPASGGPEGKKEPPGPRRAPREESRRREAPPASERPGEA